LIRYFRSLSLLLVAALVAPAGAAQIVVHHDVARQALTLNVARLIFTMRLLHWPDGTRVRVFVLPDADPLHQEFAKRSLDLYPRQLRRVWDRHLFSGAGAIPVEVSSVEEMLRRVAETPGAVGYLPDGLARGEVRVVNVQ